MIWIYKGMNDAIKAYLIPKRFINW